jgi:heterodisulfide reductase subunit A-like polyferredoxin
VGLIPDNQLSMMAGIEIDPRSKGPKIGANYETSIPGIFASGNVLHIHDVVDFVSEEGDQAATAILNYLNKREETAETLMLSTDQNFIYALPHTLNPNMHNKLKYRVRRPMHDVRVCLVSKGMVVHSVKKEHLLPAELEMMIIPQKVLAQCENECRLEIHDET